MTRPDPAFPDISTDKRVVLRVTSGPYAGLHQIVGTVHQAIAAYGNLPDFLPAAAMPPDGRSAPAGLVAFKPRFVLYKECHGPEPLQYGRPTDKDHFSPEQR